MRGYEKRVIYMKNVGSEFFEEAYFVLKSDTPPAESKKERLVDEANRIIRENIFKKKKGKLPTTLIFLFAFILGVAAALLVALII